MSSLEHRATVSVQLAACERLQATNMKGLTVHGVFLRKRRHGVSSGWRLTYLSVVVCLAAVVSSPRIAPAESSPVLPVTPVPAGCKSEQPVTTPAPVDMEEVLRDVYGLEDNHQARLFRTPNRALELSLTTLFDLSEAKSKLEQFYTMLFYLSQYAAAPGEEITFDVTTAQRLLLSSKVFRAPEFPRQIARIHLSRKDPRGPRYEVDLTRPEVRLPLNGGLGFGVFREGMCQHAKALVFYGSFSFSLAMKNRQLQVYDFDNVDLWGTFGMRGFLNLDINYVSVKSVEFVNGDMVGLVRAKVSRKEFEINQHSFLLELVTKFVTDKSLQPIDW